MMIHEDEGKNGRQTGQVNLFAGKVTSLRWKLEVT